MELNITPELAELRPAVRRFVAEAQITAQLDHPGIVPVHELAVDKDGSLYFTMKVVRGTTLKARLRQMQIPRRPDDLEELLRAFLRVCEAVAYAHEKGVIRSRQWRLPWKIVDGVAIANPALVFSHLAIGLRPLQRWDNDPDPISCVDRIELALEYCLRHGYRLVP